MNKKCIKHDDLIRFAHKKEVIKVGVGKSKNPGGVKGGFEKRS